LIHTRDFTFYSDRYCFILNYHNGKFLVSLLCSFNCGVSDPPECSNTSTDVETNADDDVLEPILAYKHLSRLKLFITIGELYDRWTVPENSWMCQHLHVGQLLQ